MKQVTAIVMYTAYVPDDMETSDIQEAFKTEVEDKDIRVHVQGYSDDDEAEPLFEFSTVRVAESFTIMSS